MRARREDVYARIEALSHWAIATLVCAVACAVADTVPMLDGACAVRQTQRHACPIDRMSICRADT